MKKSTRRDFIRTTALAAAAVPVLNSLDVFAISDAPFTLPALKYPFSALEPHIDTLTMQIHHDKHHQAYVDNLNKAIAGTPNESASLDELVKKAGSISPAVRNNGGGHWNHTFFWESLSGEGGGSPSGNLGETIQSTFGSF